MTRIDEYVDQYKTAYAAGDTETCATIMQGVPYREIGDVIARLEAAGLAPVEHQPSADRIKSALLRGGVGEQQATTLSILSSGSFVDFVRDRMAANNIGADTVLEHATNDAAASELDSADEAAVYKWLEAVARGEDEPAIDLPDGAAAILARALGSSEQTILAVQERER
jgi:hypothetical protein